MSTIPLQLNWVEKRAACSAEKMLPELVAEVKEDVKVRNALGNTQFAAELTGDQKTLVIGEIGTWARKERVRVFALNGRMEVRDEVSGARFAAEVFLNDEGRCKLKLENNAELERWQFRRMALEPLFFGIEAKL